MSVVRIEALRALAALIELRIPELAGHVCPGTPPSSENEHIPNLSIQPGKWRFEPGQRDEHAVLPGNVVVYDVGDHEAPCVLSILAATPAQRWILEDKVLELFRSSKHDSGFDLAGVLVFQVAACPELARWVCSFELDSDEWIDTLALERRYESRIVVTATIPALTIDRPVYTIQQLILGVTEDRTSTFTPATAIPPAVELVTINDDGTISPYTP